MNSTNHHSTGNSTTHNHNTKPASSAATLSSAKPTDQRTTSGHPPAFRTTARDYVNPVDYKHPYQSMAKFADFLALRYDANRTRHAYYRQLRLIHQHFASDPIHLTESQLRDYFLFVKLKKHWKPKSILTIFAARKTNCSSATAKATKIASFLYPLPCGRSFAVTGVFIGIPSCFFPMWAVAITLPKPWRPACTKPPARCLAPRCSGS